MILFFSTFNLNVSYSQVAVFWSELESPFNDWTNIHLNQGFAWRPHSVSFSTLVEFAEYKVDLIIADQSTPVSENAIRVIEVPFESPASGHIEIASITDAISINLPIGKYQLRFEIIQPLDNNDHYLKITFYHSAIQRFDVLKADDSLSVELPLLTEANPAT